ncbi:class I SAM-dependent methyltransferase [Blastococcus sp. SYSU DS0510]
MSSLKRAVLGAMGKASQFHTNLAARDIDAERQRQALAASAAFVTEHMPQARSFRGANALDAKYRLLDWAVDTSPTEGLVLEFGVHTGDTLRRITARRSPTHGFDSFEGLPEDWRTGYDQGHFARTPPVIPGSTMHVGWFDDTLPKFFKEHERHIAFAHLDADLYSSTATIFREGEDRFIAGTVLLFDEYLNYPGWQQHEHKAFGEFIERTGHGFEYLAYNALHEQVLVRLTT